MLVDESDVEDLYRPDSHGLHAVWVIAVADADVYLPAAHLMCTPVQLSGVVAELDTDALNVPGSQGMQVVWVVPVAIPDV